MKLTGNLETLIFHTSATDIFTPPPHTTRSNKFGTKTQFHAKWFSYSLMSFLRDRNKPHKWQKAGLSDIQDKYTGLKTSLYY
jgi:hypothetical protein